MLVYERMKKKMNNPMKKDGALRLNGGSTVLGSALLLALTLVLAACGSSQHNPEESSTEVEQEDSQQMEPDENEQQEESGSNENEIEEDSAFTAPSECEGVLLESNKVIEGKKLADCMVAAMLSAGTGTHRVETTGEAPSVVDFKWDPDFSMNKKGDSGSVIIKGNTGWYKDSSGKWMQEDEQSVDPEVAMATNIIKLTRVFADPRMIREYLAASPTWTVVGQEPVPAQDAFMDVAWHLVPELPIHMDMVTITEADLWLTNHYLGAYYVSTGTAAGFTTTTSNTFLQWGKEVEIPDPNGGS